MSKVKKTKDVVRIKVWCETGYVNCNYNYIEEMDRSEYEQLKADGDLDDALNDMARENMNNYIDYGARILGDNENEDND